MWASIFQFLADRSEYEIVFMSIAFIVFLGFLTIVLPWVL